MIRKFLIPSWTLFEHAFRGSFIQHEINCSVPKLIKVSFEREMAKKSKKYIPFSNVHVGCWE